MALDAATWQAGVADPHRRRRRTSPMTYAVDGRQ